MFRVGFLAGAMLAFAAHSPAFAQSWGVGVEFGGPGYYGPPPVIYAPPRAYEYYEAPPVVYLPAPEMIVPQAVPPDVIFDNLETAGYSDFSPMAFREGVYKLNAVNRRGDLVALEVSLITGDVEREIILQRRRTLRTTAVPPPAAPPPHPSEANEPARDPLVVY